ncbi:uncharacterized protein LOC129590517 isoform X2 [Paramacrobiotus metropolitanus]|uniref:uncharacterized protein LOC129590517 isoform X2 n=1 Tax=Paramacrobiotus metropolitanus TaxID=2943436 RepID=UPI002445601A|nr:uncharacterized protein LOC129590517 isoform X2 [Paramacrobiotus metropolitanus]
MAGREIPEMEQDQLSVGVYQTGIRAHVLPGFPPRHTPFSESQSFHISPYQQAISGFEQHNLASERLPAVFEPSPYCNVEKPLGSLEAKRRLTKLYQKQWEIENYDRLNRNRLVKAMAKLIIMAKEKYDAEQNRKSIDKSAAKSHQPVILAYPTQNKPGALTSEQAEREAEVHEILRKQLQEKVREFLQNDPAERNRQLQKKMLKKVLQNAEIKKNTFINRPKTFYDHFMRRQLQDHTVAKTIEKRQLMGATKAVTPYCRYLIGFIPASKIVLPGSKIIPSRQRHGPRPMKLLSRILPHQHVHPKRPGHKRERYTKQRDPHKPIKEKPKVKEKKEDKGKVKGKPTAAKSKGKDKGKTTGKGGPPKDPEKYRKWHRRQKRQRRKRKLRKWIPDIEKRRRIKIAQEILDEKNFCRPKPNLRGMRQRIRELEVQNDRATQLIEYLTRRNEYLHEQYTDSYTKKHSEYFAVFSDWRSHNDEWFHLKDQMDEIQSAIHAESKFYEERCRSIIAETTQLDHLLHKEISNIEIDYMEILQFLQQEPNWEVQIAHLQTRPLYYEFLYAFREAAEEQNSAYISDLLQRQMHKDFLNLALLERRRMRKLLPDACKRVLEERGLLAQEQNKLRMWCNRLQRRREKVLLPLLKAKRMQWDNVRWEKRHVICQRQPTLWKILDKKKRLRFLRPVNGAAVSRLYRAAGRHHQELRAQITDEKKKHQENQNDFQIEQRNLEGFRSRLERLKHKRCTLVKLVVELANTLKTAFGLPDDFFSIRWAAKPCVVPNTNELLRHVLDKLQNEKLLERHEPEEDIRHFVSGLAGMGQSVKSFSIKAFDNRS